MQVSVFKYENTQHIAGIDRPDQSTNRPRSMVRTVRQLLRQDGTRMASPQSLTDAAGAPSR